VGVHQVNNGRRFGAQFDGKRRLRRGGGARRARFCRAAASASRGGSGFGIPLASVLLEPTVFLAAWRPQFQQRPA
jgi:hypothetical protein